MAKTLTPEMERINGKLRRNSQNETRKYSFTADAWKRFRRNKTAVVGLVIIILFFVMMVVAGIISPYDPNEVNPTDANMGPCADHIFGTDSLGRDLFSRCMYGSRISIPFGLACMVTSLIVGGFFGMLAAYFGGATDNILMRIVDILQSIPGIILAIVVVASIGSGIPQLILAMTVSYLPNFAKTVRAAFFTVKGKEYIEACRSIGASNMRLMIRHMLPNAIGHIIIFAIQIVSSAIMAIAALSYIGLGVKPPTPEWGAMLNAGKDFLSTYPHMVVFPGMMIAIIMLAFNLFGDGLRDALDPRLK